MDAASETKGDNADFDHLTRIANHDLPGLEAPTLLRQLI
jgi:hypothetical protein